MECIYIYARTLVCYNCTKVRKVCKIISVLITLNAQKRFKCAKNRLFLGYFNFFFTFFVTFLYFCLVGQYNHRIFAASNNERRLTSAI